MESFRFRLTVHIVCKLLDKFSKLHKPSARQPIYDFQIELIPFAEFLQHEFSNRVYVQPIKKQWLEEYCGDEGSRKLQE